jgi:hypothetical protein
LVQTAPNSTFATTFSNLGGAPIEQIAAGTDPSGTIEVVGLAASGATVYATESAANGGVFSGFSSLGGWASKIAVGQNADGRIEIYQLGGGGGVYHQWRTPAGSWSGWASLGGAGADLSVARETNGSIDVFVVNTSGAIEVMDQSGPNGGWSNGWQVLGAGPFVHVAAGTNANGHIEVIGTTQSGDVQHTWQNIPANL